MDPATILIGGGIALAFLLFSGKKKRRGAAPRDVQPDIVEPPDQAEPDEAPTAPPKKPGTQTVPPLPAPFPSGTEDMNAITMFHSRQRKVMGHFIDPYSLDGLASAALWLSYPALAALPGGKLPAPESLAPGHAGAWASYAEAWKRIRAKIGALAFSYRERVFFSNSCLIVVVGRGYLERVKSSIAGLVSLQPASQIADMLVNGESADQFDGKVCPDSSMAVRTAKNGIAQKIIDRYGGHP